MSSIWGSRFQTTTTAPQTHSVRIDIDTDINDVLATVHATLPYISQYHLTAEKALGTGSMFLVQREIYDEQNDPPQRYYVAVKYMRVGQTPETQRPILQSLLRELRTITHPLLRGHPHVIMPFGYGWKGSISEELRPFIVMEIAEYGTLSETLQATQLQRTIAIRERHNLALDVAYGLHALHEAGIIHGDLKTNNVLVCQRTEALGYTFGPWDIPWIAKIADFGSSITKEEADEHIFRYTGTAFYNAPEIETNHSGFSNQGSFVSYKCADIYSFGLLLWEVMKCGRFYLEAVDDNDDAIKNKDYRKYLCKKHDEPGDALLDLAFRSLENVRNEMTETNTTELWATIAATLTFCLKRWPAQRGSSARVLENLLSSSDGERPPIVYTLPRMNHGPVSKPATVGASVHNRKLEASSTSYFQLDPFKHITAAIQKDGQEFRGVSKNTHAKTESRLITFDRLDSRNVAAASSSVNQRISLQRADMTPRPSRDIQRQMVRRWMMHIEEDHDTEKTSEAYMELSSCHLLGFGVEQDFNESLNFLQKACQGNTVAKAIFARIRRALKSDGNFLGDPENSEIDLTRTFYFSNRLRKTLSAVVMTPNTMGIPRLSISPRHQTIWRASSVIRLIKTILADKSMATRVIDIACLDDLWEEQCSATQGSLSQIDISAALTEACKMGSFEIAKILASMCIHHLGRSGDPNPLHWLMMFPPEQAQTMASLLVLGAEHDGDASIGVQLHRRLLSRSFSRGDIRQSGICAHCINLQSSCDIYLPSHCMEVIGTPLHWAIRSRNLELVRKLLDLGADTSLRCKVRSRLPGEPPRITSINYNALDIALEYHLYEIAAELLGRARRSEKPREIGASLLARTTTTFSRFVIHGPFYRLALRRTIQILIDTGWVFERSDFFGEIPLRVALQNNVEEKYIIEELLQVSSGITERHLSGGENLATLVIQNSEADSLSSVWKLQQVLPLIRDPNALVDRGMSALHYCALLGNAPMTSLLLSINGLDVDARVSKSSAASSSTPLKLAAISGKTEIVRLLLRANADANLLDVKGYTALESAVFHRQFDTASLLIQHGASLNFGIRDDYVPTSTVLHAACISTSGRPSLTKRLLHAHTKLQDSAIVNQPAGSRYNDPKPPLHQAVLYADLESVEALLQYGADPDYWWRPLDLDPSHPITRLRYKCTPRDLVDQILERATVKGLHTYQLKVAFHSQSEHMKDLPFLSENDKIRERAQWEYTSTLPQYQFRLEDIQTKNQGQAAVRGFILRLKEIKRLMDENVNGRDSSTP